MRRLVRYFFVVPLLLGVFAGLLLSFLQVEVPVYIWLLAPVVLVSLFAGLCIWVSHRHRDCPTSRLISEQPIRTSIRDDVVVKNGGRI